jgi:hypothetical protein
MADMRSLAAELRAKAHELAAETGRAHAELVAAKRTEDGLTGAA